MTVPMWIALGAVAAWVGFMVFAFVHDSKVALRGSQAAKTATPRRELETSSFEAYTHCGGCGKLDYHPMREPRRVRSDRARSLKTVVSRRGEVDIQVWGGWTLEENFDVIRTCSCGHEWGQR